MASVFGHAITAFALGSGFKKSITKWKVLALGSACSILPDADAIGHKLGVSYESFWGHRGFTHSFLFALITGVLITLIFYRNKHTKLSSITLAVYFTVCTASHSLLDAMTNGGLGVAFFSPWDTTRYFFPWRPIEVSPIGIRSFFGEWGLQVLMSEAIWIGIPGLIVILISLILKKIK